MEMAWLEERHSQYENFVCICLTDADEKHCNSTYESNLSYEQCRLSTASNVEKAGVQQLCMNPCVTDSSTDLYLECGSLDVKVIVDNSEKDCRICSTNLEAYSPESCMPIVLGCSCKGGLAFAHQKCAEKWFKIKGNKNCEICGSTVKNLAGFGNTDSTESSIKTDNNAAATTETQNFCHGRILIYSILGGMLLIIVLCWLIGSTIVKEY